MKKSIVLASVVLTLFSTGVASATPVISNSQAVTKAAATGYGAGSQIKLSGAVNVRDLGGYRNKSGLKIKPNKLIRSAKLHTLTKHDQEVLVKQHHLGS